MSSNRAIQAQNANNAAAQIYASLAAAGRRGYRSWNPARFDEIRDHVLDGTLAAANAET